MQLCGCNAASQMIIIFMCILKMFIILLLILQEMQECRARMITDWCALLGGYGTNVSHCMIVWSHTSVLSSWLVIMLTGVTIATGSDTTTALFTSVLSDFCRKLHSINIPLSHLFFFIFHISLSKRCVFTDGHQSTWKLQASTLLLH